MRDGDLGKQIRLNSGMHMVRVKAGILRVSDYYARSVESANIMMSQRGQDGMSCTELVWHRQEPGTSRTAIQVPQPYISPWGLTRTSRAGTGESSDLR